MDFLPSMMFGFVIGLALGYGCMRGILTETEEQLTAKLIAMRADRYICAVAKTKTEQELVEGANKQAAERLAAQGIKPTAKS